jgi:hypothetical protein
MGLLRSCPRQPVIAVIAAAGLAVAACGGGSSGSNNASNSTAATSGTTSGTSATTTYVAAHATVIGKTTAVVVNPAISAALKQAGITVAAIPPATAKTRLRFPVSGGQIVLATLAGTVDHAGGLTFRHSGKSVTLTNFVVNTKTKQFTATVGRQSMLIFKLNHAWRERASRSRGTVVARNVKLTVTSQAATALNSDLGVSTFKAGKNFGVATLTVAYARGHR